MLWLLLVVLLIFISTLPSLVYTYARRKFRHSMNGAPMPGLHPTIAIQSFDTLNSLALMHRERFGDIFFVWNFFQPVVVICSPAMIREFFSTQRHHTRSFPDFFGPAFRRLTGLMLGAADTDRYTRLHPLFAPFYREASVLRDYDIIKDCVERFFQSSLRRGKLDLESAKFEHMPLEILTRLAFGSEVTDADLTEIIKLYEYQRHCLSSVMQDQLTRLPGYATLPTDANRKISAQVQAWQQYCEGHKQRITANRTDLFATLARQVMTEKEMLSWKELCHTLYEVTIFNVDITVTEMSTVLHNLALYPEWQDRILAEASELPSLLSYGQLCGLKQLDYFVLESARLRPAVEITFPEKLVTSQVIGGYTLPAGTSVCASVAALNRSPDLFQQPLCFDPQRHSDESTRRSFHRFGLGVRRCMGFRFANAMIKVMIVSAVRNYRISMPESSHKTSRTIIPMLPADAIAASLHFEPRG